MSLRQLSGLECGQFPRSNNDVCVFVSPEICTLEHSWPAGRCGFLINPQKHVTDNKYSWLGKFREWYFKTHPKCLAFRPGGKKQARA